MPDWARLRGGRSDRQRDAQDRAVLIDACIELADLVPSDALRQRARDALRAAGVEPVEADDGAAFDPSRFHVTDRVPTADTSLHNRVAATERPGYLDRGRKIRSAEVHVYHAETEPSAVDEGPA